MEELFPTPAQRGKKLDGKNPTIKATVVVAAVDLPSILAPHTAHDTHGAHAHCDKPFAHTLDFTHMVVLPFIISCNSPAAL